MSDKDLEKLWQYETEDEKNAKGTEDAEEKSTGRRPGFGWNIQKTIVVMLSVIIVMLAALFVVVIAGRGKFFAPVAGGAEITQDNSADNAILPSESTGGNIGENLPGETTALPEANQTDKESQPDKENSTQKDIATGKDKETQDASDSTVPQTEDGKDKPSQNPQTKPQDPSAQPTQAPQNPATQPAPQPTQAPQNPATQPAPQPTQAPQNPATQPVPTQPAATKPAQKGTYKASVSVVNSWEENGNKCYQLSGSVSNTSSVGINSWKIEKDIGAGCSVSNFWNCTCTVTGGKLVITPAEYNGAVEAGASANDIGIIISSSSEIKAFSYEGTTTDIYVADNSSGGSSGGASGGSPAPTTPVTPYVPPVLEPGTPVGNHGALSVKGADLVDKNGKKFQLKGVSTHGLQWFPQYVNKDAIKTLRDNWGANVFRLALYTHEGGYASGGNKTELEALVCKGVEACTELGMYVIIDWHVLNERNPNVYKEDAKVFFDRMSKKYKDNVNVIYEICNEPNGPGWSEIKQYADEIIPIIRKNAPNAIIIVGTPTWSQEVDQVAANPVAKPQNVMYALHFYAATHKDDLRNKLKRAYEAGTPVFVSEFSICDASGNGGIDYNSAQAWKDLINKYNLSYASWSLCNKNETSALLSPSCNKTSGWGDNDLSPTGTWIRNFISGR